MQRRHFLKSLDINRLARLSISHSMRLAASTASSQTKALATTASGAPLRTAYCYFPNGVNQEHWWPLRNSGELVLNRTMKPLENIKAKIQAFGGLDHINATAGKDGWRSRPSQLTFLTGERARKTAGKDIQAGVSIDQIIANEIEAKHAFLPWS